MSRFLKICLARILSHFQLFKIAPCIYDGDILQPLMIISRLGWVGSLMYFVLCFSYPFAVSLYHRFGFRAMAITSAILVTFSYLTTPLVPSANYLFLTYCIPQGIGCGFMDCLSLTILPEFFDKYVGLATGIRLACVATGSMIFNYILL